MDNILSSVRSIVQSDREYFMAGAHVEPIPGGVLTFDKTGRSEGVILVTDLREAEASASSWLRSLHEDQIRRDLRRLRVYLTRKSQPLGDVLLQAGFTERIERIFVGVPTPPTGNLELRYVVNADDWQSKLRFHQQVREKPDGHGCSAREWVHFEKRKVSHLGMQPFLAWQGNTVVGAVSTIKMPKLIRVKNLVIHPSCRGRGIALEVLGQLAYPRGVRVGCEIGLLAVAGTVAERLYRRAGLEHCGDYFEWSRSTGR